MFGDSVHDSDKDGMIHKLDKNNLTMWADSGRISHEDRRNCHGCDRRASGSKRYDR